VIQAKAAKLFAAASRIGAVLAGRPTDEEKALEIYGRNLGFPARQRHAGLLGATDRAGQDGGG
jgi:hypothetical protein